MFTMERLRRAVSDTAFYDDLLLTWGIVKTGRWKGVVTAFITMSDAKDEIDWEWPGTVTTEAQSNFFWQGFFRTSSPDPCHELYVVDCSKKRLPAMVEPMADCLTLTATSTITL